MQQRPGRGRCYVADRDFAADEIILRERPCAMAISDAFLPQGACAMCGRVPDPAVDRVFAASEQDWARYCSEDCLRRDYAAGAARALAPTQSLLESGAVEGPTDAMRLALRVAAAWAGGADAAASKRVVLSLDTAPASAAARDAASAASVRRVGEHLAALARDGAAADGARAAQQQHPQQQLALSADEAGAVLFAIQCNAHRVVDGAGRAVALALFPLVSMLNHACDGAAGENCAHAFELARGERPRLVVRATRAIARGEECCYSYLPKALPLAERARLLDAAYGFACDCSRCEAERAAERVS